MWSPDTTLKTGQLKIKFMKKQITLLFVLIASIAIVFTSCKKYEYGSTLKTSIKNDVVNVWKVEKATTFDGTDITSHFSSYTIEYKKDNTYIEMSGNSSSTGTWALDGNNEKIILTPNGNSSGDIWIILKLKKNEMWLKTSDSEPDEVHFITN